MSRLAGIAGEVSYPLYAIHFPLRGIAQVAVSPLALGMWPAAAVETALATVTAWLVLKAFDEPIRSWLSAQALGRKHPRAIGS